MMTKVRSNGSFLGVLFATLALGAAFAGCDSASDNNPAVGDGHAPGVTLAPGTPDNPTSTNQNPTPASANTITLSMTYVALRPDAATAASPTQDEVATLIKGINNVWSQCDIRFTLESYSSPVATDYSVSYYPANQSQLDEWRSAFDNRKTTLLVKTGTWNRSGDLGNDGSNGFSTIPPANPEGTVFEEGVDKNVLLLSHEIGHLIGGLDHTSVTTNLMDHFVSSASTDLTQAQCDEARTTIKQYHSAWMR